MMNLNFNTDPRGLGTGIRSKAQRCLNCFFHSIGIIPSRYLFSDTSSINAAWYIFVQLFLILLIPFSTLSQVYKPVKWKFSYNLLKNNEAEIVLNASIKEGWHIYSQHLEKEGPIPTSFTFNENNNYKLVGKTIEPLPISEYDSAFDMILNYFENNVDFKQKIKILSDKNFIVSGSVEYMTCNSVMCLPPENIDFKITITQNNNKIPDNIDTLTLSHNNNNNSKIVEKKSYDKKTLWGIFIAGFLGGLLALLTPCVFPMIPLTVSFFTKQSKTRKNGILNAIIYGISIIIIYLSVGLIITILLGPDALNSMASNVWMNLLFFFVFFVFALSFFGAFELTLPSSFINKVDRFSDKRGIIGIFFMAFTLTLVSFSCTGPIIGTLLVEAAIQGAILGPVTGMGAFALALALPFAFFAAFPGWMNSLPKSGSWLNSVKVTLGFLELALALKFLSNVDLAYHWGILTRELFLSLWIVIFSLMGFYLLGKIKFSNDSELEYISITRILLAIVTFAFVLYLIPGLWGAPLKLISGFPPPEFYTEWKSKENIVDKSKDYKGIDRSSCPHNLPCFHDYKLALEYAKKVNKPILIDFTGWSCVNCRKMEDKVWIDPRIMNILENEVVLVSLYVDDKTDLPEEEQYFSKTSKKKIKTIGNKWSDFQTSRYKTNSQPYYVLIDTNERLLAKPRGYTPNIEEFLNFLKEGINNFKKKKYITYPNTKL